jgi:hypothetical protein
MCWGIATGGREDPAANYFPGLACRHPWLFGPEASCFRGLDYRHPWLLGPEASCFLGLANRHPWRLGPETSDFLVLVFAIHGDSDPETSYFGLTGFEPATARPPDVCATTALQPVFSICANKIHPVNQYAKEVLELSGRKFCKS